MEKARRMVLGLTGGIGSGKSTVAEMFRQHGAIIISADQVSRDLLEPGNAGYELILREFGSRFIGEDHKIDRRVLRQAIFSDPELRNKLDSLLHPLIREKIAELMRVETAVSKMAGEIREFCEFVVEVPLLYEVGWQDDFDRVVVVFSDERQAVDRLTVRDGVSRSEAEASIAVQMPMSEKLARADHVIDNSGSRVETARQVSELISELRGLPPEDK